MAVGIDCTNPAGLPPGLNPQYIFGYVDGDYQTYWPLRHKYPNAIPVSITVTGSLEAQCCDCEMGDLTPGQTGQWARGKVAQGTVPLVYCSEASWAAVKAQVGNIPCDWWIAAYPGPGPVLYPGSVAHQWIDRGTYDQSVVLDGWIPGRQINPDPTSSTGTPFGELTMQAVPFQCTTDASGKTDLGIPLPPGCTKVVAASVDLKSVYAPPSGTWDALAVANPAVGSRNPGEITVYGAANHFYTGHAIVA